MSQQQGFIAEQSAGVVNSVTGTNGVTASPTTGSVVVSGINATTTQVGVVTLATNAQAIAGTDAANAVTSAALAAKLGAQTSHGLAYGATTAGAVGWLAAATNGQIPIGSTGNPPVLGLITSTGNTINWTFGAGTINGEVVAPTQEIAINYTNVTNAMSPYTVTATDYFISVDASAGPVTILLPNTTTSKREFVVKDRLGQGGTNNITITTVGGAVNIDGAATYVFTDNYESLEMLFNGSTYEIF